MRRRLACDQLKHVAKNHYKVFENEADWQTEAVSLMHDILLALSRVGFSVIHLLQLRERRRVKIPEN